MRSDGPESNGRPSQTSEGARQDGGGISVTYNPSKADLVDGIRLTHRRNAVAKAIAIPLLSLPLAYLVVFVAHGTPGSFRAFVADVFRVPDLAIAGGWGLAALGYFLLYRPRRRADELIAAEEQDLFVETTIEADASGLEVTAGESETLDWAEVDRTWENSSIFVLRFSAVDRYLFLPKDALASREEEWLRSML